MSAIEQEAVRLAATPEPTLDETILQEMVVRPLTSAYFEDYRAGRLDAEQVALFLAGDYAERVRVRARLSQPTPEQHD